MENWAWKKDCHRYIYACFIPWPTRRNSPRRAVKN